MVEKNPWTFLSRKKIYSNPWIELEEDQVLDPSGKAGIYGVVHFKNIAVGVIPIDAEGYTYLVGQYRYPLSAYSWEIPEGGCPKTESPLAAAQRELLEETGLRAKKWRSLLQLHTSNSVTDESGIVYLAQELSQGQAQPESSEELRLWRLPLAQAIEMALNDKITDVISQAALFKLKILIDKDEL